MGLIFPIIIIFISACSFPVYTVSTSFPMNQEAEAGIRYWEHQCETSIFQIVDKNADIQITEVVRPPPTVSPKARGAARRWGKGISGELLQKCEIDLVKHRWNRRILAHELGHCLDLGHDFEDKLSIMNPRIRRRPVSRHRHITHIRNLIRRERRVRRHDKKSRE